MKTIFVTLRGRGPVYWIECITDLFSISYAHDRVPSYTTKVIKNLLLKNFNN